MVRLGFDTDHSQIISNVNHDTENNKIQSETHFQFYSDHSKYRSTISLWPCCSSLSQGVRVRSQMEVGHTAIFVFWLMEHHHIFHIHISFFILQNILDFSLQYVITLFFLVMCDALPATTQFQFLWRVTLWLLNWRITSRLGPVGINGNLTRAGGFNSAVDRSRSKDYLCCLCLLIALWMFPVLSSRFTLHVSSDPIPLFFPLSCDTDQKCNVSV